MSKRHVIGLGEVLWDIYPDGRTIGGAVTNVAVHASHLGAEGIVVSAVGRDESGDQLIQGLNELDLRTDFIQIRKAHSTGTVRVELDERGNPDFSCSKNVAFDHIHWNDDLEKLAGQADAVVVGTLAQRRHRSRHTIHQFLEAASNAVRVFDVNFRGWNNVMHLMIQETLMFSDILKMNDTEMKQMWQAFRQDDKSVDAFFDWLIDKYDLKLLAMSLGCKGCFLTDGVNHVVAPAVTVDVVDTVGSGDAFLAGLIMGYLEGDDLQTIAEKSNYMGAFISTKKGAAPAYTIDEFKTFCDTHADKNPETWKM